MTARHAPGIGSVAGIAAAVRSGEITARSVLESSLARVAELEGDLHCFNIVTTDKAVADADAVDSMVAAGLDRVRSQASRWR